MVTCVEWLKGRRRPQDRDLVFAALFAVFYFGGMYFALSYGWRPSDAVRMRYVVAGLGTIAVLLTRERWPVTTLFASVLAYPMLYGEGLRAEFHELPIMLAAYTVAAQARLATVWVLILAEFGVTTIMINFIRFAAVLPDEYELWFHDPSRVLYVQTVTAAVVLLGRASHRQRRVADQLIAHNRELERLRGVETDQVVSAERTRIARELHDVVAHHISAMVIRAQAADRVADDRPAELRQAVRWIAANGQETLSAMRHVVRVLRSTQTGGELTPAATLAELPDITDRMAAVGLPVDLRLPSVVPLLPAPVELAAVRIVQEALTNTLVHARASRALVELRLEADGIRIEVHDDGRASAPPTVPMGVLNVSSTATASLPRSSSALGGNGLIGMRERAVSCGGFLSIGTSPLGGWLVVAVLPSGLGPLGPTMSPSTHTSVDAGESPSPTGSTGLTGWSGPIPRLMGRPT